MMTQKNVTIFLLLLFTIISLFYLFGIGGSYNNVIKNVLFLVPPLVAAFAGFKAASVYGFKNTHGKSFLFIAIGLSCFFIGETLFAIFELVLHIDPFPSVADIFYIAAYPFLIAGVLREIGDYNVNIDPLPSFLISCLSIAVGILVFNLSILPAFSNQASFLGNTIALSYGISDVVLMVAITYILLLTMNFKGGKLYPAWFSFIVATIFMLIGDISFALYTEAYKTNIILFKDIDLFWTLSYLFFAYGLFKIFFTIRNVQAEIKSWLLKTPDISHQ